MLNKFKYDLRQIQVVKEYSINGCGKKIESPYYISIYHQDKCLVYKERTNLSAFNYLMNWLESEEK